MSDEFDVEEAWQEFLHADDESDETALLRLRQQAESEQRAEGLPITMDD